MACQDADDDGLLERAGGGDAAAVQELLRRHQARLRKMIALRLDRRLRARLDPSDVLQEVLLEAHQKMPAYFHERPLPFYPWLRQLAWERLVKLHEHHLKAQKRSADREQAWDGDLSGPLADQLLDSGTSPSEHLLREELRRRVQAALAELAARDREVLVLRYLEQLSTCETAAVLGITEGAVKVRLVRALERLRGVLGNDLGEDEP